MLPGSSARGSRTPDSAQRSTTSVQGATGFGYGSGSHPTDWSTRSPALLYRAAGSDAVDWSTHQRRDSSVDVPDWRLGAGFVREVVPVGRGARVGVRNPGSGTPPVFWGAAQLGVARPDIGAAFGAGFTNSGFNLVVGPVAPGTYDVVVFARSSVTLAFEIFRIARVTVP